MSGSGDRMADLAKGVVGLSAGGATRGAFLDLIAAGESAQNADTMSKMSTCGLVVRGLWRRFGMHDPRLEAPYVPASVMTTIQGMAREAGGWSPGWARPAEVGDVVYLSAPDHVGTVVGKTVSASGTTTVTTVDGGTTDGAGNQAITSYVRAIDPTGLLLSGPLAGNGRRVVGVADVEKLALRFGGASSGFFVALALGAVGAGIGYYGAKYLYRQI